MTSPRGPAFGVLVDFPTRIGYIGEPVELQRAAQRSIWKPLSVVGQLQALRAPVRGLSLVVRCMTTVTTLLPEDGVFATLRRLENRYFQRWRSSAG